MTKYRAPLLNNDIIRIEERSKTSEQKLWVAVLAKAFDDAFYSADERSALEALRWIKHGRDFNQVCALAGRNPEYVRRRMLNKVIDRESQLLFKHDQIKNHVGNVLVLKNPITKVTKREKNKTDFKWLPKYEPDYVDRT